MRLQMQLQVELKLEIKQELKKQPLQEMKLDILLILGHKPTPQPHINMVSSYLLFTISYFWVHNDKNYMICC